ncbi:MAG: T9SS type A sorting domain-containing protein [Ignavibacteriaceae bacterium]|nr:T9SS type A sorting domain-containing protein [Ignavibacteriaceae bacterium]
MTKLNKFSFEKEFFNKSNTKLPTKFSLEQNYPNPFNPSTKIKYAIPLFGRDERGGLVTMKVYDILGKEVVTLVNEYKQTGKYEVEFDAEKLSSGVYFYTLSIDEYLASQKMILLK